MAEDLMPLSEENFRSLEEKFAEEIDDLRATLGAHQEQQRASGKQPNVSFVRETNVAIKQSEELLEELREARRRFGECAKTGRPFTDDEVAAFRYFGFLVPPSGRVDPARGDSLSTARQAYTLPSQSSARSQSALRDMAETETDVTDVPMHREATPEEDIRTVRYSGRVEPSPGRRPVDIEAEVARRVAIERERLEQDVKDRMRKSAEAFSQEVEQRVLAVRHKMQQEFDTAVQRSTEHVVGKIRQENIELKEALEKAKSGSPSKLAHPEKSEEWMDFLRGATIEENEKIRETSQAIRSGLQEMEARHAEEFAEIHRKLAEFLKGKSSVVESGLREQLQNALQTEDVVRYTLASCPDPDAIDEALVEFLNNLNFPFVIHVQRLGRGGDYFIDRRVQIRLVNGELVIRSRSSGVNSSISTQYEPLAKYLAQLYAPLLLSHLGSEQLAEQPDSAPFPPTSVDNNTQHVHRLRGEQAQLQRRLAEQEELLRAYQHQLSSRINPSPERDAPLIPGTLAQRQAPPLRETEMVPVNFNEMLRQEQRRRLEAALQEHTVDSAPSAQHRKQSSNDSKQVDTALARIAFGGKAAKEMLSKMTPSEIQDLKRRAFAKQVHEMRQRQANSLR